SRTAGPLALAVWVLFAIVLELTLTVPPLKAVTAPLAVAHEPPLKVLVELAVALLPEIVDPSIASGVGVAGPGGGGGGGGRGWVWGWQRWLCCRRPSPFR